MKLPVNEMAKKSWNVPSPKSKTAKVGINSSKWEYPRRKKITTKQVLQRETTARPQTTLLSLLPSIYNKTVLKNSKKISSWTYQGIIYKASFQKSDHFSLFASQWHFSGCINKERIYLINGCCPVTIRTDFSIQI